MKFAFATCVKLGKSVLNKIYDMGGRFEFLVTLCDDVSKDKSGRVYLDDIAKLHDVQVIKIKNINQKEVVEAIKKCEIDWLFVIGWSQIVRNEVLNLPKKGCIGMHPTLLPNGRGRASIPWAIIKGLNKTGVTMFRLDEGVDTGEIIGQIEIPIAFDMTAYELYEEVNKAHIELIEKYYLDIINDTITLIEQDNSVATEWKERKPSDGELKHTMSMYEAERLVRAVTHPYPGAYYYDGEKKVRVWSATISKVETSNSYKLKDGYLIPIDYEMEDE